MTPLKGPQIFMNLSYFQMFAPHMPPSACEWDWVDHAAIRIGAILGDFVENA